MEKKIAPSEQKAQALRALLQGQTEGQSGEELLSALVRLSTERILQEALEQEQAVALGRGRYEARGENGGYRNGYEHGTLKTGEGILRVKVPQIRGQAEPYRSQLWSNVSRTSEVLKKLIVERYVGGMSQRDIEQGLEKAVGHFLVSQSTVSEMAESLAEEYEAFRTRDLRQEPVAYLFIDTVYEPLRRWGQKTGVLCVWAICEDGRKVLLSLSTANSESFESCREVLRELVQRGLRPPATITTDGALGLTQAIDAVWPKSLRIRCWFHKMQNCQQQVPAQAWPEVKAVLVDMRAAPSREQAEQRRAAIEALGPVAHLYAPNLYHHLRLGEWAAAFPSARVHAPAGLAKKRPDLQIDRTYNATPEPALAGVVDELPIGGFRLEESVLVYRPARTVVVADLVHNIGRPRHRWTKIYTRTMGFYDRVALSRMIRWAAFRDRAAVRRSVEELLAHPFDRLVVGHGTPLAAGGREALAAAYTWLLSTSR